MRKESSQKSRVTSDEKVVLEGHLDFDLKLQQLEQQKWLIHANQND